MKKYINILIVLNFILFYACKKEDKLSPSNAEVDYFMPSTDQTDEISELKREFYKNTNVKLLFSDTLFVSSDDTILVDIQYNYIVDYTGIEYVIDQYSDITEMESTSDFVKNHILNKIGNVPPPYSVLLVKKLTSLEDDYFGGFIETEESNLVSLKTTVINVGDINAKTDDEKEVLGINVLSEFLGNKLATNYSTELKPFFDVSSDIYDNWLLSYPTYTETDQINGFIDIPGGFSLFSRKFDLSNFLYHMLSTSEEDFRNAYGNYDRIITKMELLNSILKEQFEITIY